MENFRTWLVEVAWKKMGPSLIKGAVAAGIGIMATHQGILNSLGITWDSSGHVIQLDTDILSNWMLAGGAGAIMALLSLISHHGTAVVAGAPQSGDVRKNPDVPIEGGTRQGDPK